LPIVHAQGSPEELGRQIGAQLAPLIARFIPMRLAAFEEYAADNGKGTVEQLRAAGEASIEVFRRWHPAGYAEFWATAEASGVDLLDLFCAANMTDMRDIVLLGGDKPDSEGCSALLVPPGHSATGELVCGQTWDLNPQDIDYVVAIHRKPTFEHETWSVTVAGCPTLVGMNALGLTIGTTNVKTWGARPGVGYMNILHRMIACDTAREAEAVVTTAPRSGAHVYWAADSDTAIELETTRSSIVRRELHAKPLCRTNHCLDPAHAFLEGEEPSPSSEARLERMERNLAHGAVSVQSLKNLFGDRSDGINSISRYASDDEGTATNSVLIAIPARRVMHICKGPADRGEWHELQFDTAI